jgi:hypothetical protein
LKTRITLTIGCSTSQICRELARVLTPDNGSLPRGLDITMNAQEKAVRFDIASQSPSTVLSTVMAILRDVTLFEQVWLLSRPK